MILLNLPAGVLALFFRFFFLPKRIQCIVDLFGSEASPDSDGFFFFDVCSFCFSARSLGVHNSKVRSLTLDSWEPELLKVRQQYAAVSWDYGTVCNLLGFDLVINA